MCDNDRVVGTIIRKNDSQVTVTQSKKPRPFARHRFYSRRTPWILRQFFQFGWQLCLDTPVHALEVTSSPFVYDELRYSIKDPRAE